jgi:hypothetical protein
MSDVISIAELAAKTANEIRTRGWATGQLIDEETGAVCAVGGCGAAFYGDPGKGYDEDGNGYDTFLTTVANAVKPGWRKEKWLDYDDNVTNEPMYDGPYEVIYSWNDHATEAEVLALFDKLADEQEAA